MTCRCGKFAHDPNCDRPEHSASTLEAFPPPPTSAVRYWIEQIKNAEKIDRRFGLYIPGDSALAVVFSSMEEAAYAGDPEFDSRVGSPEASEPLPTEPDPRLIQYHPEASDG